MLHTDISPVPLVTTISFAVFPSEPGAPFGHNGISFGRSAALSRIGTKSKAMTAVSIFISRLVRISPRVRDGGNYGGLMIEARFHFCAGCAAAFCFFQTDTVRRSPGLLVKSAGRSAPAAPKEDLNVSPSTS